MVTDIYWIFVRHKASWQELRRVDDAGKWIVVLPADEGEVLRYAAAAMPLVKDAAARLVKFTNLSTPRPPERKDSAVILAYCRAAEKDVLRQRLEPLWGPEMFWKTNRQTFAEASSK